MGSSSSFLPKHPNFDMKLFAATCLASAAAQFGSGDAADGEVDRFVAGSDYYEDYDSVGNKKNKNKNPYAGGAKTFLSTASTTDWAIAINCWPSNIEADQIVATNQRPEGGARNPDLYPTQQHHGYGPQHVVSSFEVTYKSHQQWNGVNGLTGIGESTLHEEDPVRRSHLGGLYQYGHDTYAERTHNNPSTTGSTRGTQWYHYKQARHAGCLYEKSEWHYGHDTFSKVFTATYYQGYSSFDGTTAVNAFEAALDYNGASEVEPVWWHFFNAHILPNPMDIKGPTYPINNIPPSSGGAFFNPRQMNSIPLVMANPAYEGLGYLNFVVEYKYREHLVGDDYLEFIDSSNGLWTNAHDFHNFETYRRINDCDEADGQECHGWGENNDDWRGVHGMYYYDLYMGSWHIGKPTDAGHHREWAIYPLNGGKTFELWSKTVETWDMDIHDSSTTTVEWSFAHDLVVSSFPHNNLGKDFRFNLRLLMSNFGTASITGAASDSADMRVDVGASDSFFYSYYFYKINEITIVFPYHVAYALYHENRSTNVNTGARITEPKATTSGSLKWWDTFNNDLRHPALHGGATSDDYTKSLVGGGTNPNTLTITTDGSDYQFMHQSARDVNMNIIPPLDLGTHAPSNDEFHRIMGYIISPANYEGLNNDGHGVAVPDWCDDTPAIGGRNVELERTCGKTFEITGLMNTYDERRGQRGTYQEIWVQLQYALGQEARDALIPCNNDNNDVNCAAATVPIQSPWPYLHFMASEIISIDAKCNVKNVNNPNTCSDNTYGPGFPNDNAYGGK